MLKHVNGTIAVESTHSFGDIMFNTALLKAMHDHFGVKITVAVEKQYEDGLYNLPWVDNIINTRGLGYGCISLRQSGLYDQVFQITQSAKFYHYKTLDPEHSLIDTPLYIGRELGIPDFDQRPIFLPTEDELNNTTEVITNEPTIAIESEARSGQSWATFDDIMQIVEAFKDTHRILWLSNRDAPEIPSVDNLLRFTRREALACLRDVDTFFCVGSGLFCASLGMPENMRPKRTVILWRDIMYKYKNRLNELGWVEDLTWVDYKEQISDVIRNVKAKMRH